MRDRAPDVLNLIYHVAVTSIERILLVIFMASWTILWLLYHFMIRAVNKRVPAAEAIPHFRVSATGRWGSHGFGWKRLRSEYRRVYPQGLLDPILIACILSIAALAIAMVVLRVRGLIREGWL